jgi:hypothetical protein
MKVKAARADVWAATIPDRPGGLSEKLGALAEAGVNLEFVVSRRRPEKPGQGVVFVTPIKGARQVKAAKAAGFQKTDNLHSVRVDGADKRGTGAALTQALAEAGLNLRGVSGAAMGKSFVSYLALDTARDAAKALAVLKKLK